MQPKSFVKTISERCRVCYTCVRECPAKAIRITEGQAEIIPERCIGCGNCVRVCSQNAKVVVDTTDDTWNILTSPARVAACVAPSFPAEFTDCQYKELVGMIRALGFDMVIEVGFGADLVAKSYAKLLSEFPDKRFIATSCPGIIAYVERYHPDLMKNLAPVVSPMIATSRALKRLHGADLKIVFVGPCIAKKGEAASENLPDEIDAALTFVELRNMFDQKQLKPQNVKPSDFDLPHAGAGGLFSISRGLLQAAEITEDLMTGKVVAAEGHHHFVEAIKEFESGTLNANLLEVLCCNGCIMGAGMSVKTPLFSRRNCVSSYVRSRVANNSDTDKALEIFDDLDMKRNYTSCDQRLEVPFEREIERIMARMGKHVPEDELNCGACGYDTCREHAIAIHKGLAESEMCLPHTIDQLRETVDELASTQEALMQSEKLAGMGQLAAGIAHEVNNPLGVVLMYAHLLLEDCEEGSRIRGDLTTIAEQADRCKKIVSGLLHFARQNKIVRQSTDIIELVNRGIKAVTVSDNVRLVVENAVKNRIVEVDPDQIIQVLTNLMSNAVAAMPGGGTLTISVADDADHIQIKVTDTGVGIPEKDIMKVFDPFFTTKQIGKGTGLGLAVVYGIVKMHCGTIKVESNNDSDIGPTGTVFTMTLPRDEPQD